MSHAESNTISLLLSVKPLSKPVVGLTNPVNSALVGTALTFKATVTGAAATATGTIALLDGGSQIAQQALDASGNAAFNLSNLTTGVHALSLSYPGDANYTAGTSGSLDQSVTDFQLALTSPSQTVSAGSTATYTLTITPQAGFTGNVTFSCSGLPPLATCTVAPVSVGATVATGTVTISTTAATTAENRMPAGIACASVLLGCLSLWGRRPRHRTPGKWLFTVLPGFILTLVFGSIACGDVAKKSVPGTPSGTSTVTITATATQNGVIASHSSTATLIVQ